MKTRQKRCAECGGAFTYHWEDLGDLYSETCIDCMLKEMREEEEREIDRTLGEEWLQLLKR